MKNMLLSFAVLLLPLVVSPYPVTNCTSQCWSSNKLANIMRDRASPQQKQLLGACGFGCRSDKLNRLMLNSQQCQPSCEEAYEDYNEQLACFIGCNLNNNEEDVYTNNNTETISFMTVIYQTVVLSLDSFWSNTATTNQGGQVVYFVFSNGEDTSSDQSTSTSATPTVAVTEDPKAVELWLIIQILCALLLVLSLLCCCCMCSGEARNYSNKKSRTREITNCQEHKYKLLSTPPVTTYTLPVKVGGPL